MMQRERLQAQLPWCLVKTSMNWLGEKYEGKVRDCYVREGSRVLVTTDRLSCFDVVVTSIPCKGETLTATALYWFDETKDIVDNHVLDVPHPNVIIGRECEVLPIEVVMRAYLTGSAWRDYAGGGSVSGITLPPGLRRSEKLADVIVTPSTKAAKGTHDEPISEKEIVARGIVPAHLWAQVREVSSALFARGQERAASRGLILVDTKYEFGVADGKLVLVDEIHTMDSSRYWVASSYADRFARGEDPEMLDKEPVRQWLIGAGFMGDGPIPPFSDEYRVDIAIHYIKACEMITGRAFSGQTGDIEAQVRGALESFSSAFA